MNLEESNSFVEEMEKNSKRKKNVLIVLGICGVIILILFALIGYIKYKDASTLKMYIDGKQINISQNLLMQDEEMSYFNVKRLAEILGYSYQNGGYKEYTEDSNSCYLKNKNEIVSMKADSYVATKYILNNNGVSDVSTTNDAAKNQLIITDNKTGQQSLNIIVDSEDETSKLFSIENPIKNINDELYVPFSEVQRLFNIKLDLSVKNKIKITSLNKLILANAQLVTSKLGYQEVSNIYENLTAIVDNMIVVGNGSNYGVVSLADGHEIISLKYQRIVYMQNTKEFFVTAENSVGIVSSEGKTIIKPTEYDDISSFDEVQKLYLTKRNKKYGVVNKNGETIIYPEYDSIGIPNKEDFPNEDIRNFNLLFEECIPVESNGKYGILDIKGNERLKCNFDSLGYVSGITITSNNTTEKISENLTNNNDTVSSTNEYENLLIIPESVGIKGIIINFEGLYGIYDVKSERIIIPCSCTKIYSITRAGKTKYYLEYEDQQIELEKYLEQENLKSIDVSEEKNDKKLSSDESNE